MDWKYLTCKHHHYFANNQEIHYQSRQVLLLLFFISCKDNWSRPETVSFLKLWFRTRMRHWDQIKNNTWLKIFSQWLSEFQCTHMQFFQLLSIRPKYPGQVRHTFEGYDRSSIQAHEPSWSRAMEILQTTNIKRNLYRYFSFELKAFCWDKSSLKTTHFVILSCWRNDFLSCELFCHV